MFYSYTDLQTFRHCPRLFAFRKMGWQAVMYSEPMETGTLVHLAIAGYFKQQDWLKAMVTSLENTIAQLQALPGQETCQKALENLNTAFKRAMPMAKHYIESHAGDYGSCRAELEIESGDVVIHPDLIAMFEGKHAIVDFKTARSPDVRWYDFSGQLDLYAYVLLREQQEEPIDLVIYDVISDDGFYRHVRVPHLDCGAQLYGEVKALRDVEDASFRPYPKFDCPNKCAFFDPCYLMETGDEEACFDYLKRNYKKEREDNAKTI